MQSPGKTAARLVSIWFGFGFKTESVGVTSGQKRSTKIIYNVLQTSIGLF